MTSTLPSSTPLKPRKGAILVGASGGIGSALARKLADEGYSLALFDRNAEPLQNVCDEINTKAGETRALAFPHDVTKYESIPGELRKAVADLGGLDLFVYAAGYIYFPQLTEYNFEQDRRMVEVNLLGAMAWMRSPRCSKPQRADRSWASRLWPVTADASATRATIHLRVVSLRTSRHYAIA